MHDLNFIYFCEPEKNTRCNKKDCQKCCFMTSHKEFSKDGKAFYWNKNQLCEAERRDS